MNKNLILFFLFALVSLETSAASKLKWCYAYNNSRYKLQQSAISIQQAGIQIDVAPLDSTQGFLVEYGYYDPTQVVAIHGEHKLTLTHPKLRLTVNSNAIGLEDSCKNKVSSIPNLDSPWGRGNYWIHWDLTFGSFAQTLINGVWRNTIYDFTFDISPGVAVRKAWFTEIVSISYADGVIEDKGAFEFFANGELEKHGDASLPPKYTFPFYLDLLKTKVSARFIQFLPGGTVEYIGFSRPQPILVPNQGMIEFDLIGISESKLSYGELAAETTLVDSTGAKRTYPKCAVIRFTENGYPLNWSPVDKICR